MDVNLEAWVVIRYDRSGDRNTSVARQENERVVIMSRSPACEQELVSAHKRKIIANDLLWIRSDL